MDIKRIKPEDAKHEQHIITSMIVSNRCCREIIHLNQINLFQSAHARTIAMWCAEYFEEYEEAPKEQIEHIFEQKSNALNETIAENISKFLRTISDQYETSENFNDQYWMDFAAEYFYKRSYEKLGQDIIQASKKGSKEADKVYENFKRIALQYDPGQDILDDDNVINLRLDMEYGSGNVLFKMPGALGQMMGPMERESFHAFLGREKVGKSYVMEEIFFQSAMNKLNAAYLSVGDMTKNQMDVRNYSWITRKYHKPQQGTWLKPVLDCLRNQDGTCHKGDSGIVFGGSDTTHFKRFREFQDHEVCIKCWKDRSLRKRFKGSVWWKEVPHKHWEWNEALKKTKAFKKRYKCQLIRAAWPMHSITVTEIERWLITKKERDGFVPDVLIIDYADILAPENPGTEKRHQENEKWMRMRALSQKFHCCVVTATQSDAKGYKKRSLELDNFNEDKRKYGHVTHFYALNKTLEEEKMKVIRVAPLLFREKELIVGNEVTVLQGIYEGKPYLSSFFGSVPGI